MFFYEGLSCPHCHRPFHESDDIVSCPVCGAPHHRGCWGDAGGCACAADHGTDKQWSRDQATRTADEQPTDGVACPRCGSMNSKYAEMCATCGATLTAASWGSSSQVPPQNNYAPPQGGYNPPPYGAYPPPPPYQQYSPFGGYGEQAPFHVQSPYGGVSPDTVIEGESVRDIAAVVRTNTTYYMPRFERIDKSNSKISWNWAAFFIPTYWLLHRKQYIAGGIMLAFDILYSVAIQLIAMLHFYPVVNALFPNGTPSYADILNSTAAVPALIWPSMLVLTFTFVRFLIQIYFGMFGNRLYMRGCLRSIRRARDSYPEGYHSQLSLVGGTSIILAIVAYFCIDFIPMIISMLIQSL